MLQNIKSKITETSIKKALIEVVNAINTVIIQGTVSTGISFTDIE